MTAVSPTATTTTTTSADVVVVGGGPAGLTAALTAARRGRTVVLVEASEALGGMAASFEVDGQRVDYGSHRLHPSAPPAVAELLDELLGADLQTRQRNGRLHLAGRWVRFPLQAPDLLRSVPPSIGLRIGGDLLTSRRRTATDDSYAEFVRAGLGPTVLERFHGPMASKLWGMDPAELSGELARRRISVNSGGGLARRIARTSRSSGRVFRYPRLGYGQIVDRLAAAAVDAGVQIRTSRSIRRLTPGAVPTLEVSDGSGLDAGRVFWAAPLAALASATGRSMLPVEHRALLLVYLVLDETQFSPVDAHYVPDADVAFARLSEPKNYRDGPDPPGRTVLCAELPCTVGDGIWRLSAVEAGDLVLDGMRRVGLRRPLVATTVVRRLPRVYPVLRRDDSGRTDALAWARHLEGVAVLGRQGLHVADNLHHVMDMGLSASACLDDEGWNAVRWARERRRFDEFVVDD